MGWSGWHQSPDVELAAWGRFLTRVSYYRDPVDDTFDEILEAPERLDSAPSLPGYDPNVLAAGWVVPEHSDDDPPRDHIQFLLGPNNEDPVGALALPPLPDDYFDVITPDAGAGPGGLLVQWEADQGEHLGWAWDGVPTITHREGGPLSGAIEVIVPSLYFTAGSSGYDLDDHPHYPLPHGVSEASFGGSDPEGTELAQLPDPGPVFGFAVTITPSLSTVEAGVGVTLGDLYARIRYPRWRYWRTQDPPIRVHPRGDDLGFGSGRILHTGTAQSAGILLGGVT